jgi:hypothetical protein
VAEVREAPEAAEAAEEREEEHPEKAARERALKDKVDIEVASKV